MGSFIDEHGNTYDSLAELMAKSKPMREDKEDECDKSESTDQVVKVSFPFSGCSKCEFLSVDSTVSGVYANNRLMPESRLIYISCRHELICRNAVDVWKDS